MPRVITLLSVAAILSGCDPSGLGYANRLSYPVTVVEDSSTSSFHNIRLASGETHDPEIGVVPRKIEIFDSHGHLVAHYRIRDIPRERGDMYVVLTPQGAVFKYSPREKQ